MKITSKTGLLASSVKKINYDVKVRNAEYSEIFDFK